MVSSSTLDQPNGNGPKDALKACFNEVKDEWGENYGTTKFTPPYFNSVIMEAWGWFTQKAAPICIRAFIKVNLFHCNHPTKMIIILQLEHA